MELYYIYLQLPGTIRIVIDIFLLVLVVLWFFLPFAVIGTNRRLTKLLESNKRVEDNIHRISVSLRSPDWNYSQSLPDFAAVYEEPDPEDTTPLCGNTCQKCQHMNDIDAQTCSHCNAWL